MSVKFNYNAQNITVSFIFQVYSTEIGYINALYCYNSFCTYTVFLFLTKIAQSAHQFCVLAVHKSKCDINGKDLGNNFFTT